MSYAARRLSPIALTFATLLIPTITAAQSPNDIPATRTNTVPRQPVFSFVLRQAGAEVVNPFASSGRREVLQLMAVGSPFRGQFRRARLDRIGQDDWSTEGWYEIRGNVIQLYHSDAAGNATGRVEVGRYLESSICLNDPENGQLLAYVYLKPASSQDTTLSQDAKVTENDEPAGTETAPSHGCAPPAEPIS
jgi:hypothetical protein